MAMMEKTFPFPRGKLKRVHSDAENYQMLLEDPQVASCLQQRFAAITSAEWIVEAGGDRPEDEKAAAFLRAELARFPFDEATRKMASASFYGFSVAEIIWQLGDDKLAHIGAIKVRKRERFTFGRNGEVFLNEGNKKTEMPPRKFWTVSIGAEEDDSPYGHGLAHKLYWPVKFKRAAQKAWMTFLNQYGHKVATVRYNQQADEAAKKKALEIAQKVAAGHSIAMPQNMEVILLEGFKASVVADYEKMIANMNDAITKICLSQTMTTDNGSSRAQATVHMEVRSEVVKSDADHLCASFNNGPVQWLIAYNFPTAKPPKIWRRFEKEPDLQAQANGMRHCRAWGIRQPKPILMQLMAKAILKNRLSSPMHNQAVKRAILAPQKTLPWRKRHIMRQPMNGKMKRKRRKPNKPKIAPQNLIYIG